MYDIDICMERCFTKNEFNLILLWSTITSNVHTLKFNLLYFLHKYCTVKESGV
jgi:hypothetical protein